MHSKNSELMILVYFMIAFSIPSTLGVYNKSNSMTGTVTAARWDVSITPGNNSSITVLADGTNTASYSLDVTNDSEVDVTYTIVVSGIPSGVEVKLDNGSFQTPSSGSVSLSSANTSIDYSDLSHTKTHTLTFKASSGASIVNNQSITVDVEFQQVL